MGAPDHFAPGMQSGRCRINIISSINVNWYGFFVFRVFWSLTLLSSSSPLRYSFLPQKSEVGSQKLEIRIITPNWIILSKKLKSESTVLLTLSPPHLLTFSHSHILTFSLSHLLIPNRRSSSRDFCCAPAFSPSHILTSFLLYKLSPFGTTAFSLLRQTSTLHYRLLN